MNKNNLKTFIIAICIIILVLCLSILASEKSQSNKKSKSSDSVSSSEDLSTKVEKEAKAVKSSEQKDYKKISVDDFFELYNGDSYSLVLIGRDSCQYCNLVEPILKNISYENNLDFNYLNTENVNEDDKNKLISSNSYFSNFGTPTLLVVQSGNIVDNIEGITTKEKYVEFLKKYNFINE